MYREYPKNRLIVDGVDLTTKYGLILEDGYVLTPPSPKTYIVDIPGGNGKLDLTETLLGDTAYDNRKQEFVFRAIGTDNFEKLKTEVSNFLHGKAYSYKITMDPDYTYTGRFTVTEYNHAVYTIGTVGAIKIEIDAAPFKYKDTQVRTATGIGGNVYYFESGRERVKPVLETDGPVRIIYNGKILDFTSGSWVINDLLFTQGTNELYLNTCDVHTVTWGDLIDNQVTWGQFKQKRLFEWYKTNGSTVVTQKNWSDLEDSTWGELADTTWGDHTHKRVDGTIEQITTVTIKYEWGDL